MKGTIPKTVHTAQAKQSFTARKSSRSIGEWPSNYTPINSQMASAATGASTDKGVTATSPQTKVTATLADVCKLCSLVG